jgi:hypothetical protein
MGATERRQGLWVDDEFDMALFSPMQMHEQGDKNYQHRMTPDRGIA